MPILGEHKTVQARILNYAQDICWTFVPKLDAEERGAGFPCLRAVTHRQATRQSRRDPERNSRAPLSLFTLEGQQEEIVSALATCDGKANFAKHKHAALQDIFCTLLHEPMTLKIQIQAENLKVG